MSRSVALHLIPSRAIVLRPRSITRPIVALCAVLLFAALPASSRAQTGLSFDGVNDHVTFGVASDLGVSQFTLELWFRRTGTGATTSTGSGGITAVPLFTKGRGEADGSLVDMNWFLGIRGADNVLTADYEEGSGQTAPGLNHPVAGTTAIRMNTWYHAAATFDGTTWRLYLNGNLEATLVVGAARLPQSASTQHAALATAMTSAGAAAGFFQGTIDEPRLWNVARTQEQIRSDMVLAVTSGDGLRGRWGLDENTGSAALNSVAGGSNGTIANGAAWVPGTPFETVHALAFTGTNGYVTFGAAPALGLSQFTIECWFRRDGAGTTANTGTGGMFAVPLVTKGVGEAEASTVDMNWFLGIRGSDGVIAADFEEGAAGASPGLNHPVAGVTPIVNGVWYHAAATYDGTTWRLYLNGSLEATLAVGQPPRFDSVQHGALASALNSTGVASGFFAGALDEVRVWNVARTAEEIVATINVRLGTPTTGLVARWGLDEGAGTTVRNAAAAGPDGTITGTAWSWADGAPFDAAPPTPPDPPATFSALATTHAQIHLAWADVANETAYEIERSTSGSGGPFTPLVTLAANTAAYDDGGLTALTEYCYRIRATNGAGASSWVDPQCAATPAEMNLALDFAGAGSYVTFGDPAALDLAQFTIECWFRRDGAGTAANTGAGGLQAIPLVTKGNAEQDGSAVDMNWFLGIRASDGVLCADFEEAAGGATPGLNHPVAGVTPIAADGSWHHAAATYDGTTWALYLDGAVEAVLTVGQPPRFDSVQHAGLAVALNSTGTASGAFDGALDEVRVWSAARSQIDIQGTANAAITDPTPGLVARWGLNEGSGTAVHGSAGTAVDGVVIGATYTWTAGAPFDLDLNLPPPAPVLAGPPDAGTGIARPPSLSVSVSDPDGDALTVTWYGRPAATSPASPFTLIGLPDTQYYTSQLNGGTIAMMESQTGWIVANRIARDIRHVIQLGDCTEHGDNGGDPVEWIRADGAFSDLEDPLTTGLPDGIPYGICVGNHDQSPIGNADGTTTFYNQYFGEARFQGRAYYGGHYGTNNDNHFALFEAGGMSFIAICLEYDTTPDPAVLAWADALLDTYANRRAIVATHNLINTGNPATFSTQGQAIYDALKGNPNLFLMLGGHVPGEGRRQDTFNGHTVHSLLSDYQARANGGSGWLRILEFSPAEDVVRVRTYSPWLDQYEADADSSSQFTFAYEMTSGAAFTLLGSQGGVPSGTTAALTWPDLGADTAYEWYVTVSDGHVTTAGPTWSFTTAEAVPPQVQVISPNGGEILMDGDATLQWNATDNVGVTTIDLWISRDGAAGTFAPLAEGVPNTGTYVWTVTGPSTPDAWLRVMAHDAAGNAGEDLSDAAFEISSVVSTPDMAPALALAAPVPNPVRGPATFAFRLPRSTMARLSILDVRGREVAVLADGMHVEGAHHAVWDMGAGRTGVSPGLYFVRLSAGGESRVARFVIAP